MDFFIVLCKVLSYIFRTPESISWTFCFRHFDGETMREIYDCGVPYTLPASGGLRWFFNIAALPCVGSELPKWSCGSVASQGRKVMVENWNILTFFYDFYGENHRSCCKNRRICKMRSWFFSSICWLELHLMRVRLTCPEFLSVTRCQRTFEFGSRKGSHLCTVGEPPWPTHGVKHGGRVPRVPRNELGMALSIGPKGCFPFFHFSGHTVCNSTKIKSPIYIYIYT